MASTPIDSQVFGFMFSTPEMKQVFSDENLVQKWLDIEAAIARAQAERGIIPQDAADEIQEKAKADRIDIPSIGEFYKSSITIVPLLKAFMAILTPHAREYLHWSSTTQDIFDSATSLLLKEAHAILLQRLRKLEKCCYDLAEKHRDTIMVGRTQAQQAMPITFGFKAAIWAAECSRHVARMEHCAESLFLGEISGAVGTLASMGDDAMEVRARIFEILGLKAPVIAWHVSRDHIAAFISLLGIVSATGAKIASEVMMLQRTEYGELEEPYFAGKIGSSTMPHKRNPQACANVVAIAKTVRSIAPLAMDAMVCSNERDWTCELSEWEFIPRACILTDTVLEKTAYILADLRVYPKRMEDNMYILRGLMLSEAVSTELSKKLGHHTAHDVLQKLCMDVFEKGGELYDALVNNPVVSKEFSKEELKAMLNPYAYTGYAGEFVDAVLKNRPV